MLLLLKLLVIFLAFISHEHEAMAAYTSMGAPVTKHTDAAIPLYSVQIITAYVNMQYMHKNFLIDIDAPLIWHDCVVYWDLFDKCPPNTQCTSAVSCQDYQCSDMRTTYSSKNPTCRRETNTSGIPGADYQFDCTCPVNVINPVTGACDQALLNYDNLAVNTSNGRNFYDNVYYASPNAACAPSSSFASFPADVTGVMALSSSPNALPTALFNLLNQTLALCLPSTPSAHGVLFFGNGPYYLNPKSDVDIKSYLTYTPLLKHPNSFGYFIGVNSIVIKKRSINIPANATTKLSTIDPYTTLRTDIYNQVLQRFSKVTKRIPRTKAVSPFGLCYRTSTNGTQAGLQVPDIDFGFIDGKKWSVSTSNSIKQITKDVACLAFVDGGAISEPAIVIGTFQFEDNFLEFDLHTWTFGFSSSLLRKQTSCANFNFTLTHLQWWT